MALDRRTFIKTAALGAGAAALGAPAARATADYVNITRPSTLLTGGQPSKTNIDTVVVVMMENRSTDHYLGWWGERLASENAGGNQFDARTTLGPAAARTPTDWGAKGDPGFHEHRNYTGHKHGGSGSYVDPGHGHGHGRHQILDYDGDGISDGWGVDMANTRADEYALSYYTDVDLPVISRLVQDFTTFDRYFCSWMGNTYPNRYYMHSAQSHGIANNDFPPQRMAQNNQWAAGYDWPTLWDFLTLRGVTWKYYFSNLPAIGLFGARNLANTRHITEYYADAAAGTLPQVCFVDPFFVAPEGLANDDHPHADIRLGQEFYSDVITGFLRSPQYARGALFLTYDEWGGFWDHVTPPNVGRAVDPLATTEPGSVDYRSYGPHTTATAPDFGLYGFRVPTFLVSPFAKAPDRWGRTNSGLHDHTTILQFIADNWGLPDPGQWEKGVSRRPVGSMLDAFDRSVLDPDARPDLEVDVEAYEYVAPPEARTSLHGQNPEGSVSDLWGAADWLEDLGYTINTRFADALPATR